MPDYNENVKSCHYCGKIIQKEDVICGFCGYNFQTGTIVAPSGGKPSGAPKKIKFRIPNSVKLIVAVAILFVSLYLLMKHLSFTKININTVISNMMRNLNKLNPAPGQKAGSGRPDKKMDGLAGILKQFFPEKTIEEKRKTVLILEGIAFDPKSKSFATINGEILCEGESIGGIKVNKINEDSVELIVNGETKILQISQSMPSPSK